MLGLHTELQIIGAEHIYVHTTFHFIPGRSIVILALIDF